MGARDGHRRGGLGIPRDLMQRYGSAAIRREEMAQAYIKDQAPAGPAVTDYDREHAQDYLRLLDAAKAGAPWGEVVSVVFGVNADAEPERARRIYESHLARANWVAERGHRGLLRA
jgi:hypothetical protein